MTEEDRPEKIDVTPTIYGEAYATTSNLVNTPEFPDRLDDDTRKHIQNKILNESTEKLVQFVMYRRVLQKIVENEDNQISQEKINQLHEEIIEEDGNDERVINALTKEEK